MNEKGKFKGFDDTGWDDIENYTKKIIERHQKEKETGKFKDISDFSDIPNFLKK